MSENTNPAGRYPHVVRAVMETPWAIELPVLAAIRELVAFRAAGGRLSEQEIQARIGPGPSRRDGQMVGSVAVLPLHGVITPRADLFTEMSGGTSVQRFQSVFGEAVDDKKVSAIVLDVSSPGGMTDLIPELAADIRAARSKKPVVAVANTKAASAAYWLASQADKLYVTPSGSVGSIGVYAAHDDISAMQEKLGIKTTLISAGKFKTEGNPFEPLSDEARDAIQQRVDEMHGMFTADVAKGRRVPVGDVRGGFGEGRMLTAKQALNAGMVDGIRTLQATVDDLASGRGRGQPPAEPDVDVTIDDEATSFADYFTSGRSDGRSFIDEAEALRAGADHLAERAASLAEVERGHLTVAKRERLTACTESLRASVAALEGVLADTDPDKRRSAFLAAVGRHELEQLRQAL